MFNAQLSAYICIATAIQLIVGGESASARNSKGSISNWKDKLSQVLDTETQELGILHDLISSNEVDNGGEINTKLLASSSSTVKTPLISDSIGDSSVPFLREQGILSKLEDNSKRMDSMVSFLNDLKNVLTEAIATQNKQMKFETEVVELREEIEFLRKEVQHLKHEQDIISMSKDQHTLEHKVQNDEATMEWLKESTKELQSQLSEVAKGCNASTLIQIQQRMEQQSSRQQVDLHAIQKQIEAIKLQQMTQEERMTEAKGDIEDVRSWQASMGQKFVEGKPTFLGDHRETDIMEEEEHFLTEALKNAASFSPQHGRHSKKLKAKLREISKITKRLSQDHYHINKRLAKVERSQKAVPINEIVENLPEFESRVSILEDTVAQYSISLQNVGEKVNIVNELQESTTQLFMSLEDLETKYDEKLTEMQTNVIKIEENLSSINNSNEDLKEQNLYHSGITRSVKKDLLQTKGQLQKNHFRLASLQTQLLKWAGQKCSVEDADSIQNIRISSVESFVHLLKRELLPHIQPYY